MDDTRNVIDYYKYWTTDAIKADLDEKRHDFSVVVSNEFNDFNLGTVIRNANAFLASEVIVFGKKKFDRRGTVGTHLYENLRHVKFVEELCLPHGSVVVGVDNVEGAEPIEEFSWPKGHVVLAFGQESIGLQEPLLSLCDRMVYIRQYGSVRSLNVGVASGIAMYTYCREVVSRQAR